MDAETIISVIQLGLSVALVALILLQRADEGGLGAAFGGGDSAGYHTKRGFERYLFIATIVAAVAFGALAIISLLIQT